MFDNIKRFFRSSQNISPLGDRDDFIRILAEQTTTSRRYYVEISYFLDDKAFTKFLRKKNPPDRFSFVNPISTSLFHVIRRSLMN